MPLAVAIVIGILLASASFYIQVRPRIENRFFGVDGWRHLSVADYMRRHKKYPGYMRQFLIEAPSDYPPGLRILLSLLPKKFLDKYEWAFCPAVDFCHNLFLFAFVYYLTKNAYLAFLSQITYMLVPMTVMENSNLTTRSLASFLFTLSFLSILGYTVAAKWPFLIMSVFFISLLLLSHRMAVQALTFLVVVFSIFDKSFAYILIFLSGIFLAILISKGFYLKILRGHLAMLQYWHKNIKYRYAHEARGLPKKKQEGKDTVYNLYQFIKKAPFIAVLGANPFIVFAALAFLMQNGIFLRLNYFNFSEILVNSFLLWAGALFLIAVAVRQIGAIEFIGEGERYLEYAAFPISILTSLAVMNGLQSRYKVYFLFGYLVIAVCFSLIPFLLIQHKAVAEDTIRSIRKPLWEIFSYINTIEGEVRMMCVPLCMTTSAMYFTKARVLSTDNSLAHITNLSDVLPVIKMPLGEIFKKYNINYLLINEDYVGLDELGLRSKNVIKKEDTFSFLKLGEGN